MRTGNTLVVVARWNEDLAFVRKLKRRGLRTIVYEKCDPSAEYNVPVNRGNEASAYLKYIVDHYDSLPVYSVFLHCHERSWHHEGSIVPLVADSLGDRIGFRNLNNYVLGYILSNPVFPMLESWYEDFLEPELGPHHRYGDWTFGHLGCAQFIVHRSLIRRRSKRFYTELYEWIVTTKLQSAASGRFLEWTWHLMWDQVPRLAGRARAR